MAESSASCVAVASEVRTARMAAVNVASVPQRSPLRYPGGKTWLVPHIRHWLNRIDGKPTHFVEPFAGGAIASLTAVMEDLADKAVVAELDADVAAFWRAALGKPKELCAMIRDFDVTPASVQEMADERPSDLVRRGFRTLVLNRTRRGGIIAPGASFLKQGENSKGIASRWYQETLLQRIEQIAKYADRIDFREMDGMDLLTEMAEDDQTAFFVDPPYTAGDKQAGKRLYSLGEFDHAALFTALSDQDAEFMMTYEYSDDLVALVQEHGFEAVSVSMKNTHHDRVRELLITPRAVFEAGEAGESAEHAACP